MDHVEKTIRERFGKRLLRVDGGNYTAGRAQAVKANFDASLPEEKQSDDYDILLTTDKLSEGVNLNRAGLVVNYDIPWNPTRVIQRVGRINRIGKKVFENLHIFNFFPTKKGSNIVANRVIAENKMFAIHQLLGEDARIFSPDEEPTASALFDKLRASLDSKDTLSSYTKIKQEYARAKNALEKKDPHALERLDDLPDMVKTAWKSAPDQTLATFMFKRRGGTFSVIAYEQESKMIREWILDEALGQIACTIDEPREPFSPEFWKFANGSKNETGPRGIYESLKRYAPKGIYQQGGVSDAVAAINAITQLKKSLPARLQDFAAAVADDIQNLGTIPAQTLRRIAECGNMTENAANALAGVLKDLRASRGEGYLAAYKKKSGKESIIVTVEKH